MVMESLIFFNSKDGSGTAYYTEFFITPGSLAGIENAAVSINQVIFVNGFPFISEWTDKIYFQENGAGPLLEATLTHDNYSGGTLATEIASQMNAVGGNTYTCVYDSVTKRFEIAANGVNTVEFFEGDYSVYRHLGFTSNIGVDQTTHNSADVSILKTTCYVDLYCNFGTPNFTTSGGGFGPILRIPVTEAFNDVVAYTPPVETIYEMGYSELDTWVFQLRDDQNRIFAVPDSTYLSVVVHVNHQMKNI